MKPEFKIKKTILLEVIKNGDLKTDVDLTSEERINEEYYDLGSRQDYEQDFREGEEETNIPAGFSRYCELKSVAAQMFDGSWVGWTYEYGGGKHFEARNDWYCRSYDLECKEEEKLVLVRTFKLIQSRMVMRSPDK